MLMKPQSLQRKIRKLGYRMGPTSRRQLLTEIASKFGSVGPMFFTQSRRYRRLHGCGERPRRVAFGTTGLEIWEHDGVLYIKSKERA